MSSRSVSACGTCYRAASACVIPPTRACARSRPELVGCGSESGSSRPCAFWFVPRLDAQTRNGPLGNCNVSQHIQRTAPAGSATPACTMSRGPTLARVSRRAWLIGGMSLVLVAAAAVAYARTRAECGEQVTSLPGLAVELALPGCRGARASSPTVTGTRWSRLWRRRRPLSARCSAPSATTTSSGPGCRRSPRASACVRATTPTSRCSTTARLKPRWSVRSTPSARRTTPATAATWSRRCPGTRHPTSSRWTPTTAAGSGAPGWVRPPSGPDDPFATQILDGEDVAVLLGPAAARRNGWCGLRRRRLGRSGSARLDADSGDFLGDLGRARC